MYSIGVGTEKEMVEQEKRESGNLIVYDEQVTAAVVAAAVDLAGILDVLMSYLVDYTQAIELMKSAAINSW